MKYTAKRNISLVIAFILIGSALGVFFGLIWPGFKKSGELNRKLGQEKEQYKNQEEAVQIAKSIINQYKSLANVSQTISLSIPRDAETQNILAQIEAISLNSGITVQNISFENLSAQPAGKKEIVKNYRTLRLTLSLNGTYEAFKTWLSAVESNVRVSDVSKISFVSTGSENQKTPGYFNFKVTMSVYYQ